MRNVKLILCLALLASCGMLRAQSNSTNQGSVDPAFVPVVMHERAPVVEEPIITLAAPNDVVTTAPAIANVARCVIHIDGLSNAGFSSKDLVLLLADDGLNGIDASPFAKIASNSREVTFNRLNKLKGLPGIVAFSMNESQNMLSITVSNKSLEAVLTQIQNTVSDK